MGRFMSQRTMAELRSHNKEGATHIQCGCGKESCVVLYHNQTLKLTNAEAQSILSTKKIRKQGKTTTNDIERYNIWQTNKGFL